MWLLNSIYAVALGLLSPLITWRLLRHGRYRRGLSEKLLGRLPISDGSRLVVWFHAVSVGEVLQLPKVVAEFRRHTANRCDIVISTSTDTGYDLAVQRFADCTVTWFPLDFSWAVNKALDRVRPDLVVLTELEIWPGFLGACRERKIATGLINARMSDRSFRGYRRIRRWIAPLMEQFTVVATQTDEYASRLIELGASEEHTTVTGSVKFDGVQMERDNPETQKLGRLFDLQEDDLVLIAGSTQDPEERYAVDAVEQLQSEYPHLRLILVPRHPERFDLVASMLRERGTKFVRRSQLQDNSIVLPQSVILLDTIGELGACWGLANLAFVGGSFGRRGGQNMLEPAAYGAAVMFGPNTWNFKDIVHRLLHRNAAIELTDSDAFAPTVASLIKDASRRTHLGEAAQEFIRTQQGAIAQTVTLLAAALPEASASHRSAA